MKIFCWEEIYNLFSCSFEEIKNSTDSFFLDGTAISVGCFDGPHLGHKFLFSSVLKYSKDNHLKSGLVTFLRPLPSLKFKNEYLGDIATLNQRLSEYEKLGFDFRLHSYIFRCTAISLAINNGLPVAYVSSLSGTQAENIQKY